MTGRLAAEWENRLGALRRTMLHSLPVQDDGSAAEAVLARRTAVRGALPGKVTYFAPHPAVVRIELTGMFAFARGLPASAARDFVDQAEGGRLVSMTEPGGNAVWVALGVLEQPALPLDIVTSHALSLREEMHVSWMRSLVGDAFASVGFHPDQLPTPLGTPDPRIRVVARPRDDGRVTPISETDLVVDMQGLKCLRVVPGDIEDRLRNVRRLYLNGWGNWDFFTLAARDAAFAVEASLRSLVAEGGARDGERTFAELARLAQDQRWLTIHERTQLDALRQRRNMLVHQGGPQMVAWIGWAWRDIDFAARVINLMWARRHHLLPSHVGREVA